ncbi:MAG TPA: sugar ABC transporter permease [Blastocatellia bacterium]|nr:sugar ABC transporter permease [Blastocatellia bacterium]
MEDPTTAARNKRENLAADTAGQTKVAGLTLPREALRAYTMVLALIVVWVFFQYATGGIFLEARNFSNLMRQTAVTGVLSVGMLMVIVTGQIDLSIGSVVGLAGGVAAAAASQAWLGWALIPSLFAGVVVGLLIGAAHGVLIAYANIPAFIVTLGGLLVWRGVIKGISQGNTIPIELEGFKAIGQCYLHPFAGYAIAAVIVAATAWQTIRRSRARQLYGLASESSALIAVKILAPSIAVLAFTYALNSYTGVPAPVIILLGVALLGTFITQNTTFGRYLYAIGGNPEAARLSGINIRRHLLAVFCIMGVLAGVAALIYTARVGSASPDAGVLLELDAIAACVIGGASLMGGRGTVVGACIGALFMASLDNGMSLKNLPDFTQDIIKGAILVGAVGLDMLGRRKG